MEIVVRLNKKILNLGIIYISLGNIYKSMYDKLIEVGRCPIKYFFNFMIFMHILKHFWCLFSLNFHKSKYILNMLYWAYEETKWAFKTEKKSVL